MNYIEHTVKGWEIKYGQISFTGIEFKKINDHFNEYIGMSFDVETHMGLYKNKNLLVEPNKRQIRLAIGPFFRQLNVGDVLYIYPLNLEKIKISDTKLIIDDDEENKIPNDLKNTNIDKLTEIVLLQQRRIQELEATNIDLIKDKERLDKIQSVSSLFKDEKFMEDWLERNMHRVIPDIEILDRQPIATWSESFMRNRMDFFCVDKITKDFIIVENKVKGRNRHIDSQYLTYRTWVIKNQEKIREKYGDDIKSLGNPIFVIITDTIDIKLENICEVNKIPLIHLDGGIVIDEIFPYNSDN